MKLLRKMHELGQRLWLDNITRTMLEDGTLQRYIDDYAISGLTSNPSIFEAAIGASNAYDDDIRRKATEGKTGEILFNEIALETLREAADLFLPMFRKSEHLDGWVSMEISPLLVRDAEASLEAARKIHALGDRPNLFVKIPGTPESLAAIEGAIYAGIPVNVTLLFSVNQYEQAAEAYLRGLENRLEAGLPLDVASVASLFVSRWDAAVHEQVPGTMRNVLGLAICQKVHEASDRILASERWQRLAAAGARPQRLLWASTGSKDPQAPASLYAEALVAPGTINTLPEKTLLALAELDIQARLMARDDAAAQETLKQFSAMGIDLDALAQRLQQEGADAFVKSWEKLLLSIREKSAALAP